ncbi:MAG: hypothetical protein ACT4TC_17675 [Myxococcaceae bacterium]
MAEKHVSAPPDAELQQLWFAIIRREWSSLVVIPAQPGGSTVELAKALAAIGTVQRGTEVRVINAQRAELRGTSKLIVEMTSVVRGGGVCLVAVDSVVENQAGIPLALAADAALLAVTLGETDLVHAKRTLELVGESRFVGSVTIGS